MLTGAFDPQPRFSSAIYPGRFAISWLRIVKRPQRIKLRGAKAHAKVCCRLAHSWGDGPAPFHRRQSVNGAVRARGVTGVVGNGPIESFDRSLPVTLLGRCGCKVKDRRRAFSSTIPLGYSHFEQTMNNVVMKNHVLHARAVLKTVAAAHRRRALGAHLRRLPAPRPRADALVLRRIHKKHGKARDAAGSKMS